jgi:hypothetical protein
MNDTLIEIEKKYKEIIMSVSNDARFKMGLEMTELGRQLMIAGIKAEILGIKEKQLNIEILKRIRQYDESLYWLDTIVLW